MQVICILTYQAGLGEQGIEITHAREETLQGRYLYNIHDDLYWGCSKLNNQVISIDATPTQNSTNAVSSGAVYDALNLLAGEIDAIKNRLNQA